MSFSPSYGLHIHTRLLSPRYQIRTTSTQRKQFPSSLLRTGSRLGAPATRSPTTERTARPRPRRACICVPRASRLRAGGEATGGGVAACFSLFGDGYDKIRERRSEKGREEAYLRGLDARRVRLCGRSCRFAGHIDAISRSWTSSATRVRRRRMRYSSGGPTRITFDRKRGREEVNWWVCCGSTRNSSSSASPILLFIRPRPHTCKNN